MITRAFTGRSDLARPIIVVLAIAALVVSLFAIAQPALATHVDPVFEDGNPTCASIGLTGATEVSFDKAEINPGTHDYDKGGLSITITSDADKMTFSFEDADPPIAAVIVKAGDGANVYEYDPAVTSDTELITPDNDGGQQAGLSHFVFCLGEAGESESQSQSQSVEQSVSASQSASVSQSVEQSVEGTTGTPEQSVAGVTGSPAASVGSGSTSSAGGTSSIPAIAFAILMLVSLGGLAAVNMATVRRHR